MMTATGKPVVRTIFRATLRQDSDLSIGGLDRESSVDRPFTIVNGELHMRGSGIRGAAVSMARRFFDPLPRGIAEDFSRHASLRESLWRFWNARPMSTGATAATLRSGVGIRHKTAARAKGVLYDSEVSPLGTEWQLLLHVRWTHAWSVEEAREAEGILGYVLSEHWKEGRCWLGGGVSRGSGWGTLTRLDAFRLDEERLSAWQAGGCRVDDGALGAPEKELPTQRPTRSWSFWWRDVAITFGEYRPTSNDSTSSEAWGIDGLAIGPHDRDRQVQSPGTGQWATPPWEVPLHANSEPLATDRAILMRGSAPLLPGTAPRQAGRQARSRWLRRNGVRVVDPHDVQGAVGDDDPMGRVFGSTARSSQLLVRDAVADGAWSAARLHMHAEDEFSGGSYESAKRDAVRLLSGRFVTRFLVEGPDENRAKELAHEVDWIVQLGGLGHLPMGGHKTRGAGFGRWEAAGWSKCDVIGVKSDAEVATTEDATVRGASSPDRRAMTSPAGHTRRVLKGRGDVERRSAVVVVTTASQLDGSADTLAMLVERGRKVMAEHGVPHLDAVAWWCEPRIDLSVEKSPRTFGWDSTVPNEEATHLRVDEVHLYAPSASWRACRIGGRWRWCLLAEGNEAKEGGLNATRREVDASLRRDRSRFAAALQDEGEVVVREWLGPDGVIGFTLRRAGVDG